MKLGTGQSILFPAQLISPDQSINCYIMCDSIGEHGVVLENAVLTVNSGQHALCNCEAEDKSIHVYGTQAY